AAPDVVDQHVDVTVLVADLFGQSLHLLRVEMVDRRGDGYPAQVRDQLSGLFDRFGAVVLGAMRACAPASADDGRTSFAQGRRDAAPGTARRPRHDGHATTQRTFVWKPAHR